MKALLKKMLPYPVLLQLLALRDRCKLWPLRRNRCEADALLRVDQISKTQIFASEEIAAEWEEDAQHIAPFEIPDGTGGVNPGDRRAIYYLISQLAPRSVLEVGTHIGASTAHIALALNRRHGQQARLVSVDIADVNDPRGQPWLEYGVAHSPRQMVQQLGCGESVQFVTQRSLDFLAETKEKFDFIFLDGNHSADVVYRETPAALRLLADGGVVLLHDYYPGLKPLWSGGDFVAGPCLALSRLCREGAPLTVAPLGELPWPTKLGSRMTSLALLLKG